jgi:hypothetical protein
MADTAANGAVRNRPMDLKMGGFVDVYLSTFRKAFSTGGMHKTFDTKQELGRTIGERHGAVENYQ